MKPIVLPASEDAGASAEGLELELIFERAGVVTLRARR
jgi:hypothetical protein